MGKKKFSNGNREGKLKNLIFTLVISCSVLALHAQEDNEKSPESISNRPVETAILLEQAPEVNPAVDNDNTVALPGLGFGDFARMLLVLGFVIALVYAFFWLLKRLSRTSGEREDLIRIVSTQPLKGDAAIHLVEVASRLFLVGRSGNAINLITEIDNKEFLDEVKLALSRNSSVASGGFANLLGKHFRSEVKNPKKTSMREEDPASYLRSQKERLKDL